MKATERGAGLRGSRLSPRLLSMRPTQAISNRTIDTEDLAYFGQSVSARWKHN
jgi:hypothetical protein